MCGCCEALSGEKIFFFLIQWKHLCTFISDSKLCWVSFRRLGQKKKRDKILGISIFSQTTSSFLLWIWSTNLAVCTYYLTLEQLQNNSLIQISHGSKSMTENLHILCSSQNHLYSAVTCWKWTTSVTSRPLCDVGAAKATVCSHQTKLNAALV